MGVGEPAGSNGASLGRESAESSAEVCWIDEYLEQE